jgi:cell division protein FtsI (penicillin-binding protein 3)
MPIDNVVIHDTHVSKWLTPTQILQVSSNIGMSKIALGLGPRRLYEGMKRFGFAEPTGLPLPAESAGVLRPRGRPWVPVETAAAGFGQGVSVTNVQMAMGMAALANKGQLLEPILVRKVTDSTGAVLTEATPKVRRRVVPRAIARLMAEMLTSVTEGEGTGVEAAIDGFRVAGKTATAQKIDPNSGRYKDGSYVASFLGFVPADAPRLVVAVVIDEPMGGAYAGGTVAAPVFRRVSEASLRYLGVRPEGTRAAKLGEVAEYAKGPDPAKAAHEALRGAPRAPEPEDDADAPSKSAAPPGAEQVRVPDLTGLPMRAALQALLQLGLRPTVNGTGRVDRTEPAAGASVGKGSEVTVVFEPPS